MNSKHQPVVALVAAAGSGTRLGAAVPKALVELAGTPLVRRSVEQLAAGGVGRCVVTIPAGFEDAFAAALAGAPVPCELVVGGAERQDSVRLGLAAVGEASIVLVHDAARPMVPAEVTASVIEAVAAGHIAVVPVTPMIDSLRELDGENSWVVERSNYRAVQTPQGFDFSMLVAAHELCFTQGTVVTDDASCCEVAGHRVHLVTGARESFKITEPIDLMTAEALLAQAS